MRATTKTHNEITWAKNESTQVLNSLGITCALKESDNKKTLETSANSIAVMQAWERVFTGINWHYGNDDYLKTVIKDESYYNNFTGITPSNLKLAIKGNFDKSIFLKARNKIKNEISALKFQETFGAKKRRRIMSEHDGELDFDRLWEVKPFYNTQRDNSGAIKTMKITVDFCVNSGATPESLANYGAIVWALIDLLESNNISCDVTMRIEAARSIYTKNKPEVHATRQLIKIKKAGEYLDTLDIARCFTPWFFRRCSWALESLVTDAFGECVAFDRGAAVFNPIKYEKGELQLNPKIQSFGEIKNLLTKK